VRATGRAGAGELNVCRGAGGAGTRTRVGAGPLDGFGDVDGGGGTLSFGQGWAFSECKGFLGGLGVFRTLIAALCGLGSDGSPATGSGVAGTSAARPTSGGSGGGRPPPSSRGAAITRSEAARTPAPIRAVPDQRTCMRRPRKSNRGGGALDWLVMPG
jgi:hypothetical protein